MEGGELIAQVTSGNMDGGDIITKDEVTDFDLKFDFKVGSEGNSGVFYRVKEHEDGDLWQVAPEYRSAPAVLVVRSQAAENLAGLIVESADPETSSLQTGTSYAMKQTANARSA